MNEVLKECFLIIKSIKKINDYYIVDDGTNKFLIKVKNTDTIYLYNYFSSIGFDYYLPLIDVYNDVYEIYPFYEDVSDNDLKAKEEIKALAFLHSKSYYEEKINDQNIKELYEEIKTEINDVFQFYLSLQDKIDEMDYLLPQYFCLVTNTSSIYDLLKKGLYYLEKWYENNNGVIRKSYLILNNSINNFTNGKKKYFIDFKNCRKDLVILDFLDYYKNNVFVINMNMIFKEYNNIFKLGENEKYLLFALICIPKKIVFTNDSYGDTIMVNNILNYTFETLSFLLEEDKENQKTDKNEF